MIRELREKNKVLDEQVFEMKKELRELTQMLAALQEMEKTFPLEIKKLTDKYNKCVDEMKKYQEVNDELEKIKKEIIRIL